MTAPVKIPTLTPVKSSNIEAAGHDGSALYVQFRGGAVYRYPTAAADVHQSLIAADSPGSYFQKSIRAKHTGSKLT